MHPFDILPPSLSLPLKQGGNRLASFIFLKRLEQNTREAAHASGMHALSLPLPLWERVGEGGNSFSELAA